ncbi:MAG: RNA degradosome polyphosphate kinase [Clostridiales bacterium]|nr:RNA degradosome polyphosphate kinase [Clostridiales bacterium]
MNEKNYSPAHFIGRELSWLEFNQRVIDEAVTDTNPVFERMKFLSIAASNLDEFFMIRVASIWDQIDAGYMGLDAAGLNPLEQISAITARVRVMMRTMYDVLRSCILPELYKNGIRLVDSKDLTAEQAAFLDVYFDASIYPVLTPMAVDAARPFPLIYNRSLNLGLLLENENGDEPIFATVQVPSGLERLIRLPSETGMDFMLLEDAIALKIDKLFVGQKVLCCHAYRITRNADLSIDEDDAVDLLQEIEKQLKKRRWGNAVRLEIDQRADSRLVTVLEDALELEAGDAYPINGPINLDFLMKQIYPLSGFEAFKYPPYKPRELQLDDDESLFSHIRRTDVMLYHPYDSFDPVVNFIRLAARDKNVLAIKQTLYRVSGDSPIVQALMEAADAGKQVTVLLELKARFDEENNIHWGRRLERAGAHVIYGIAKLKTHSKIALVVRKEDDGIRRYLHLGTGNYNDVTARIYTDHGFFTCDPVLCDDASAFFNMLTGLSQPPTLKKLIFAPNRLREELLMRIDHEAENARAGRKGEIFAKMNSLVDEEVIRHLYDASSAGVKIRLIVRGICCLRPGIPGISDNIRVRSIVGRYLEHSRIFCFHADGRREVYLSSADWMPRNLDRRVELMFPIEKPMLRDRLYDLMELQWKDNRKACELTASGKYEHLMPAEGEDPVCAQEILMKNKRK